MESYQDFGNKVHSRVLLETTWLLKLVQNALIKQFHTRNVSLVIWGLLGEGAFQLEFKALGVTCKDLDTFGTTY